MSHLILPAETLDRDDGLWICFEGDERYPTGLIAHVQSTVEVDRSDNQDNNVHIIRIIPDFKSEEEISNLAEDLAPFVPKPSLSHELLIIPAKTDKSGDTYGVAIVALTFS